jgi:serine/threonine-protein kinase
VERAQEERIVGATVAGKYRIRRVIGAGSMGVVCEAEHLEIGKRLAIKLIDASLAGLRDIAMRFRQEARAASLVESQHIVQVFDVGADEKLGLYLVMEYLNGRDLAALLDREGRLESDTAVRIAVQVARGLAKAHDAGVVHRDLKPANIFLCEREDDEPFVKILDFGISKVIDASRAESKLKLTRAGTVVGTPQYMSPEQARGFSVDVRTDVWALGLVVYEMLAGRPAYPELPTYEQFIIHLVSTPPEPLSKVAPWVPEALARVVHQSLTHDLEARIPNCVELMKRLLEAHPLANIRSSIVAAAEVADTFADTDLRKARIAATDPSGERMAFAETDPRLHTEIMSDLPLERSVAADADDSLSEPTPPSSGRRASSGRLSASGVRDMSGAPESDYEEDAPQFFDRKALEHLASQPKVAAAPVAGSPADAPRTQNSRANGASVPRKTAPVAPVQAPARAPVARPVARAASLTAQTSLVWVAAAVLAVLFALVMVLALR